MNKEDIKESIPKIEPTEEQTKDTSKQPDEKDEKIKELTNTLQRLQAEFENYQKRTDSEKASCIKMSSRHVILQILPIIDNFELALKNTENKEEFIKGIEMIFAQLHSILENEGLTKIETEDQKFDPNLHEALMQDNKEDVDDNIITEEFQRGYKLNDEVIRHSKVKVNKK